MRVATKIVIGNKVVGTERFHHMGPAQGTWWQKYSWWVIPLGVILLVIPAISYWSGAKIYGSGGTSMLAPQPVPVVVSPVVVQQPVPVVQPLPPPITPSVSSEAKKKEAGDEPVVPNAPKPKPKSLWELNP